MADVKKLTKKLEKITGYKAAQIAIHRDEGHINEDGDFVRNIHAHVIFYARDLKTGLSLSTANYGRKDLMRLMQDAVADELGMERGRPAEETGKKHLSPRAFKAQKRQEAALEKNNAEWEAKLAQNNAQWEQKKAEWERKQAEREARQAEWERRMPEIMAARRRNEQFLNDKVDWETLKVANRAFLAWHDISTDILGYPNPQGNLLVEQTKGALASIFRLFGSVTQLAIFLLTRREARELKLQNSMNVYKVSENLQRAINLTKNDTTNDHRKIAEKIQSVFTNLPHDKRQELIELAILHAPNSEIREDIKALVEGRFSDIARTEAAQKRIENRDLGAELRIFSEEIRKFKEELREMDEENRILNLAERALLKEKGSTREEYAEQEAENRKRIEDIKKLKDEIKNLNNTLREQKQREQKDAKTIADLNDKIAELNEQISKITAENIAKQKELESEKAARKTAEIITPKMLEAAFEKIDELEAEKKAAKEQKPEDAFNIIDKLEQKLKEREEPKSEPEPESKIEPKPEQKLPEKQPEQKPEPKKDDFTNIYGYARPAPEPRRRFDYEPRKRKDDRPRYEPEPEKIEPIREPEPRDEWQEIEESMKKWQKTEDIGEKTLMTMDILAKLKAYEKSGLSIPLYRELMINGFRRAANYDPVADELEAQKNAETLRKLAAMNRELEQKRKPAEIQNETAIKYEDVKVKNVRQEDDARQRAIKKKKDEYEMDMI